MNGGERSMVPIGSYERVMPLDIMATHFLRDLLAGDTDSAQALGALELDEEDLGLCTYVCQSKYEYGPVLRDVLTRLSRKDNHGSEKFLEKLSRILNRAANYRDGMHCTKQPPPSSIPRDSYPRAFTCP